VLTNPVAIKEKLGISLTEPTPLTSLWSRVCIAVCGPRRVWPHLRRG